MGSTFNPQILVEKLTKLNASQASIETLSHWCIFHMNKAKYVVETWNKQFHCAPREQRLAFLYLANDILQNSRRKGADFVAEFWKFLPGALHDVIENGDASGRNQALRLINIWDERKVFGSRGHVLKDELLGRRTESNAKTGRQFSLKLNQSAGSSLDKVVSGYEVIYGGKLDEDVLLNRCRNVISFMEKATKDVSGNINSGQVDGAHVVELQHQHDVLRGCIDQLKAVEASRARLVSHLQEALQEQEFKLDEVRTQLQAAQSLSDQAANKLRHSSNSNNIPLADDQVSKGIDSPKASQDFAPENLEQPSPVLYTRQAPFPERSGAMDGKSTAAAVAAKLTASTSSAQMLTFVLSSLAQEGVIGTGVKDASADYPPEKKQKLENDQSYVPQPSLPHLNTSNNDDHNNLNQQQQQQITGPSSIAAHQQQHSLKLSTISASPAVLPFPQPPSSSASLAEPPALSPDITPLFPTPAGSKATPSPVESSLPIIPSSPSPPNPDDSVPSPEPETAVSPTGSLPESAAVVLSPSGSTPMALLLLLLPSLIAFW